MFRPASRTLLLAMLLAAVSIARSTSQPSAADRARISELSRRAADLIDQRHLADAEETLHQALALAPDNTTCLYNLAVVHAGLKRGGDAVQDLERATDSGFTDFSQLTADPAFAPLFDLPTFQRLLARKDEICHKAGERILAELKAQFGDRYHYEMDEPHKLVFAVDLDRPALDAVIESLHTEEASQGAEIFSHRRDEFLRVIVASPVDFARQEHRYGVAGRYDDATRTLLVKSAGAELRHEFTHALHAADQHALGQEHPVWLSEGLATMFETPSLEAGRMIPGDTWRLARVQAVARHDNLISIEQLLKMDRAAFTARAELAYGEAGSLLLYLYEHHLLKTFYDSYTVGYEHDPIGRDALKSATGVSIDALQKQWVEWLLPRPVPPRAAEHAIK